MHTYFEHLLKEWNEDHGGDGRSVAAFNFIERLGEAALSGDYYRP